MIVMITFARYGISHVSALSCFPALQKLLYVSFYFPKTFLKNNVIGSALFGVTL